MAIKHNSKNYQLKLIEHVYSQIPAFTDVFTEETFYITATCFVVATIATVFVISRFVTLRPVE